MQAVALRTGDRYVEVDPADWARLSTRDRKKTTRFTAKSVLLAPASCPGRVHVARRPEGTDRTMTVCIPAQAGVTLVAE